MIVLLRRALKLRALLAEPQYRRALCHGVAASVEHDRTPLSHNYLTVLDIGANRGQFALVATRRFPQASLICCEPQALPRARLQRALAGHPRLRLVGDAVAASAGSSVLHITQADDSSSLLQPTDFQANMFPGTRVIGEEAVPTERLDVLFSPADLTAPVLLKIDVQGTELDVLRGASGLMANIDTILLECSFVEFYRGQALANEIISFVMAHGFGLTGVVSPSVDKAGSVVQADLVFEKHLSQRSSPTA